jgi:hypothetical protein
MIHPGRLSRYGRAKPRAARARIGLAAALLSLIAVAGCTPEVEAPTDSGVCWRMISPKGKPQFLKLTEHQPDLEHCAANLEAVRLKFLRLGGSIDEVDGAYQGEFIFIDKRGVFVSQTLNGIPFPALVPTGDGRLATPGAASRP